MSAALEQVASQIFRRKFMFALSFAFPAYRPGVIPLVAVSRFYRPAPVLSSAATARRT
jgi:hypothetical protein